AATDRDAIAAMKTTTRTEGLLPELETAHAIAVLPKLRAGTDGLPGGFPAEVLVLLGFSGRGDKDMAALARFDDVEPWESVGLPSMSPAPSVSRRTAPRRREP